MSRSFHHPASVLALCLAALVAAGCGRSDRAAPPAPALDSDNEVARGFAIGTLQATTFRDGFLDVPNDNSMFAPGGTPQQVAALLLGAGASATETIRLSLDCLLVRGEGHVMLFDTGAGATYGEGMGRLVRTMASVGISPAEITDIFISHVHGDHVGGLIDGTGAAVFKAATIHLSQTEWNFLKGLDSESAVGVGIPQYEVLMAVMKPKVKPFAPGAEVLPGLVKAVELGGHTPGQSGYMIGEGPTSVLYVGDVLHHPVISVQKPDWSNGTDLDRDAGIRTRKALLERAAEEGQRIFVPHFPYPGIGRIVKRDAGYAWMPE